MASRLHGRDRQSGDADAGKAEYLLKRPSHREQADGLGNPIEIVLALVLQIIRFDEGGPGMRGQVFAKVTGVCGRLISSRRSWSGFRRGSRHFQLVHIAQTSFRLREELPDGIDFVAKKLQTAWRLGVGRKNVQNTSAPAELAGQGDNLRPPKVMFHQPGGQFFQANASSLAKYPTPGGELLAIRDRLEQRLHGRE